MRKLIQNYIRKITENDIEAFAIQNHVNLSKKEISILYYYLQNEYETLLYHDSSSILEKLKAELSPSNYEKVVSLFLMYKEKYKRYL